MLHLKPAPWLGFTGALACAAALGQQNPPESPAAPASAPVLYRSAFENYRTFSDEQVQPWKDSNATVEKIGGWRAYAGEAQGAHAPEGSASSAKATDPHAGHAKP